MKVSADEVRTHESSASWSGIQPNGWELFRANCKKDVLSISAAKELSRVEITTSSTSSRGDFLLRASRKLSSSILAGNTV